MLSEVTDSSERMSNDLAFRWGEFANEETSEGRFTVTVSSDESHATSLFNGECDVIEERSLGSWVLVLDIVEMDQVAEGPQFVGRRDADLDCRLLLL